MQYDKNFFCKECKIEFQPTYCYRYTENGKFVAMRTRCPDCDSVCDNKEDRDIPREKAVRAPVPKREHRDRAPVVPARLDKILEKEKEYRNQNKENNDE